MSDDEIKDLFTEMRDEPIPPDSIVRVRSAIHHRMQRRGQWFLASSLAAVSALIVMLLLIPRPQPPRPSPIHRAIVHKPVTPAILSPVNSAHPPHRTHPPRRKPAPQQAAQTIRIETADPNIVILLLADNRTERNQD